MRSSSAGRRVLPVLAVALALSACSGDDGSTSAGSTSAATTTVGGSPPGGAIVALCPGFETPAQPRSVLVERAIPEGTPAETVDRELRSLTAGLTEDEATTGLLVPWPDGEDVLLEVRLDGNVLTVDFVPSVVDTFIAAPGTSSQFFVPLVETALRQEEVQRIEMVIDGSVDRWVDWWQGEGSFERSQWRERAPEPTTTCPPPPEPS